MITLQTLWRKLLKGFQRGKRTRYFPKVDFSVVYQARTIGELFPFKDKTNNVLDRSLVVYSIKCKTCQAEYIGKNERALSKRIEEHRNVNKDKRPCATSTSIRTLHFNQKGEILTNPYYYHVFYIIYVYVINPS